MVLLASKHQEEMCVPAMLDKVNTCVASQKLLH